MEDLTAPDALLAEIDCIARPVRERIDMKGLVRRTVTLGVECQDFRLVTRARSLPRNLAGADAFAGTAAALLRTLLAPEKGIRLLGAGLSNLGEDAAGEPPRELELPL
ncbi:MAG TPA: hypothetical protein VF702_03170 [Allosphingosinicella sp.]|jgi:DNA polymerase-4